MSHRIQPTEPPSYQGPVARSIFLHGSVILLIALALWMQRSSIEAQVENYIEALKVAEQEQERADEEARRDLANEAAMDKVEMEIADVLRDDIETGSLTELQEQSQQTLREIFEQMRHERITDEQLDQIRTEVLDQLHAHAQEELVAAIIHQISSYIHETLAPRMVVEMEISLRNQGGREIVKQVRDFMRRDTMRQEQRTIFEESLPEIHQKMLAQLEADIKSKLVPEATAKVLDQFEEEIKPLPLNHEELRELIAEDVLAAVTAEMQETSPQEETATLRPRSDFGVVDPQGALDLEKVVAEKIEQAEAFIERQDEIMNQPDSPETTQAQAALTTGLQEFHEEILELSHEAMTTATGSQAWKLGGLKVAAEREQAVQSSAKAVKEMKAEAAEPARDAQKQTAEHLQKLLEPLQSAQELLLTDAKEQAERAEKNAPVPVTPEIEEKAAELAEHVEEAMAKASEASIAEALEKFKPTEVMGPEFNEELQAALEFQQKIAAAQERMEQGRELSRDVLETQVSAMEPPGTGGIAPMHVASHQFNREAYEAFIKDLKNRTELGNVYGEVGTADGLVTKASAEPAEIPAYVYLTEAQKNPKPVEEDTEPRAKLVEPDFKTLDFAAAPMQTGTIKVDGDLSDWGEIQPGVEDRIVMKWYADDEQNTFTGGTMVRMRWAPEGLYFGYQVENSPNPRIPRSRAPFSGDVLEVWLDLQNTRDSTMKASQFAHQFIFTPFGMEGSAGTFVEYGRGARDLPTGELFINEDETRGLARGRRTGTGYTVEAFIAIETLSKPVLIPGSYLAVNFSVNRGSFGGKLATQWSASKSIDTYVKPDTWGDVLLVGTDAGVRIVQPENPGQDAEHTVVGQPIHLEITDQDMNMRPDLKDRVAASLLTSSENPPLFVILEETEADSGVFRASADTQSFFKSPKPNTLNIRQGDTITFEYRDPRAANGEANRVLTTTIPVAWSVYADN